MVREHSLETLTDLGAQRMRPWGEKGKKTKDGRHLNRVFLIN